MVVERIYRGGASDELKITSNLVLLERLRNVDTWTQEPEKI